MVCVDEVVMVATVVVAAAPWYKSLWKRICGGAKIPVVIAVCSLFSGCVTRGALEAEVLAREQHERTMESRHIFDEDSIKTNSLSIDDINSRLRVLEEIAAPKKPSADFDENLSEAVDTNDAIFCVRAVKGHDEFGVKFYCQRDCDAVARVSSETEVTDKVRDWLFAEVRKCRIAAQDRAFNRLVCGKEVCPK